MQSSKTEMVLQQVAEVKAMQMEKANIDQPKAVSMNAEVAAFKKKSEEFDKRYYRDRDCVVSCCLCPCTLGLSWLYFCCKHKDYISPFK